MPGSSPSWASEGPCLRTYSGHYISKVAEARDQSTVFPACMQPRHTLLPSMRPSTMSAVAAQSGYACAPRLGSSIKANLTYYLGIGVAACVGIGLLLVSGKLHAGDLLPLAMLLANTYGAWGAGGVYRSAARCIQSLLHCTRCNEPMSLQREACCMLQLTLHGPVPLPCLQADGQDTSRARGCA